MCWQWMDKPLDVERSFLIRITSTIADILRSAGQEAKTPYRQTPLDFVDNLSPSWLIDVQPHLGFSTWSRKRPLSRFNNDRFPVVGASPSSIALFIVNMVYAGIHAVAWNFDFPTELEMWLWRSASVTMIATTFIFWTCESYQDGVWLGRWRKWRSRIRKENYADGNGEQSKTPFIPT